MMSFPPDALKLALVGLMSNTQLWLNAGVTAAVRNNHANTVETRMVESVFSHLPREKGAYARVPLHAASSSSRRARSSGADSFSPPAVT